MILREIGMVVILFWYLMIEDFTGKIDFTGKAIKDQTQDCFERL